MPVRAIARKLGISRNTVRRAIADDAPPKYQRTPKGSIGDAVERQIRELLEQWPEMPATLMAERIGRDRGLTVLKDRIRDLRPAYRPADPALRTVYEPGEIGQCDLWFPPGTFRSASARQGGHRCYLRRRRGRPSCPQLGPPSDHHRP